MACVPPANARRSISTLPTPFPLHPLPSTHSIQLTQFTNGLFTLYKDATLFKNHLRDFLVMLKEFAGEDSQDLFLEDPQLELETRKKAEFEAALKIPGMIKPHDRPDEGMMD
jgi:exportin-1